MKNRKGITLISLVITVIILLIIASVGAYSGISVINSSKLKAFTTELEIMQTEINQIYQKAKDSNEEINISTMGDSIEGAYQTQANKVFTAQESGITSYEGYRYWSKEYIKSLKIEGIEQDFFVNVEKRSVVSYNGFKYENKMYYTLQQLPNSLYNVDYTNPNKIDDNQDFTISKEKLGNNKWRITISDIKYSGGYINKWAIKYAIDKKNDEEESWKTTEDMSFVVNQDGRYKIVLFNGEITSKEQYINLLGSGQWNGNQNSPKFKDGMKAVYWKENNEEVTEDDNEFIEEDWYNYVEGDSDTDSKDNHWANCKTEDGSYWVWIPRYEYRILSGEGISNTGKIEVRFIPTTKTTADTGYKIHPAFTKDLNNGGWDEELDGIWVAKYEMSGEKATGENFQPGNVATLSDGSKLVSKPGVQSWRSIDIGNVYSICISYADNKGSHLMKNSEWGAVAYLTHSQYGRNAHEIAVNENTSFYTGGGTGEAYKTNINQSSTGNIYGIYDLSGGAWEYVASYITNNNENLSTYGGSFATATSSTKYATVYPYNSSSDSDTNNYNEYKKSATSRYGDAILETSSSGSGRTSWNGDYSYFPYTSYLFFIRGGICNDGASAGVFCFGSYGGNNELGYSFRAVLAF